MTFLRRPKDVLKTSVFAGIAIAVLLIFPQFKSIYLPKDLEPVTKFYIAVEFEAIYSSAVEVISLDDKENLHEFLRSTTNTFSQNGYKIKDNTYNLLKPLQRNKDIVLLSGDKDSSAVILDKPPKLID